MQEYCSMSELEKTKQIDSYNFSNFFKITPTAETIIRLKGQNLIYKTLNNRLSIMAKVSGDENKIPFIPLHPDFNLTFIIQLVDPLFYNYTDLKFSNSDKIYYFSNRSLHSSLGTYSLINKDGDNHIVDETYAFNPIFVKDKNWQLIPENKKIDPDTFTSGEKDRLFGMIRIFMRADNSALHVVDESTQILTPHTTFQIQLGNRKTYWRYIFRQDQTVDGTSDVRIEDSDPKILITSNEQPLTEKGFISIIMKGNELPNPNSNQVIPDATNEKIYSDIYM